VADGRPTPEAVQALEAVDPEGLKRWRAALEAELALRAARGEKMSWKEEKRLALALGTTSRVWRLTPWSSGMTEMPQRVAAAGPMPESTEAVEAKRKPEGLDVQKLTYLQRLMQMG
jgi:hypothetical protein